MTSAGKFVANKERAILHPFGVKKGISLVVGE
jgi:hypothetical protein